MAHLARPVDRTAPGEVAGAQLAAHFGAEGFELVLNQNRAVGLVPACDFVVGFEVRDFRRRFHVGQLARSTAGVISCGGVFFHFRPCPGP